ncbi:MAG TPA: hypothetical protein VHW23_32900 [Kofleriaceae bacterium]|nr:hypothetical protein [Kofleriaceae bacterium]
MTVEVGSRPGMVSVHAARPARSASENDRPSRSSWNPRVPSGEVRKNGGISPSSLPSSSSCHRVWGGSGWSLIWTRPASLLVTIQACTGDHVGPSSG